VELRLRPLPSSGAPRVSSPARALTARQAGRPPFRGATEYLTFQAVLAGAPPYDDARLPPDARALCEALLCADPGLRMASLASLQRAALFQETCWEALWASEQTPPLLPPPPPPPEQEAVQERCELRCELGLPAAPAAAWELRAGETELRCCAAVRKRGRAAQPGRLVLTSAARLAMLDATGAALFVASCASSAQLRAVDATHLALRADGGEEVLLELVEPAAEWCLAIAG